MSAHDDIQEGLGEAFDVLASEFFDVFTDVTLLKQSPTTNAFVDIETISGKWFFEYSTFRQNFLLQVAMGFELEDSVAEATHVRIENDVYVIRQADTVMPRGADVTWKFFCDKFNARAQFANLY